MALGCSDPEPPALHVWPGDDLRPELTHPFFDAHAPLRDLSLYAGHVEGPIKTRPDHQHRGTFAVGNGRAFALLGLADPLNTFHSIVGPVYDKKGRFFSDVGVVIEEDGERVEFTEEWISRARGSAVVVTRADTSAHSLYTVDFAPRPAGVADADVPALIVRVILVVARGDKAHDVGILLKRPRRPQIVDGHPTEFVSENSRRLVHLGWEGNIEQGPNGYHFELGRLAPGATARATLVLATVTSTAATPAIEAALARASPDRWLDDTLSWWREFSDRGVAVRAPDPRVQDLYDGMRVGVRAQQSAAGAICPMSHYTGVWLRDTIGPVRFLLRAGLQKEARKALDYLYACHSDRGDIANSCGSGLDPDDFPTAPDWAALDQFGGRTSAEGPTYLPLMYREYVRFTGDWSLVAERWAYLSRALLAQQIDEEGRQPFSGDETFRTAMSAGFGLPLGLSYDEGYWSANSAFLMLAAANWMAEAAKTLGKSEAEADAFVRLALLADNALMQHFLLPEGHFAPFIVEEGAVAESRPYEDVSLKPLWCGALLPDDPVAVRNLDGLMAAASRGDGTVQTRLDPRWHNYLGLEIKDGIATGMVPGYYLYNLAAVGSPEANAAFNALHTYADDGGQYDEYLVYDDFSALSPIYDAYGALGDYTAHYRPWEGGINLDAYLYFLIGLQMTPGGIALRPHLPNNYDRIEFDRISAGVARANLSMRRDGDRLLVTVTSLAGAAFELTLEVPVPAGEAVAASSGNGVKAGTVVALAKGENVVRYEPIEVTAGAVHEFVVELD